MRIVVAYLATALTLLILDAAWLGTVGGPMFRRTLGDVMAPSFAVMPAVLFYLLYVVGVLYFVVVPSFDGGGWSVALMRGALFGFFAYATFDLTSLAILRNYTVTLAVTDMIWGAVVTGVSAAVGSALTVWIMSRLG